MENAAQHAAKANAEPSSDGARAARARILLRNAAKQITSIAANVASRQRWESRRAMAALHALTLYPPA